MAELLQPYVHGALPNPVLAKLSTYLDLLLQWNARTNLTAVREPEAIVQRQIGESLFAAQFLPESGSLLDFGSGAGFPGIPVQIMHPGLVVTLAESQNKKAAFLREAARVLQLPLRIAAGRVEDMPSEQVFDVVAMRAVDKTASMLPVAVSRVAPCGTLMRFLGAEDAAELEGWTVAQVQTIPLSTGRLTLQGRSSVSRGTAHAE